MDQPAITLKQVIGQVIVKLRTERGLSQEDLALEAGIDRTRLGEIERGGNPTIGTLDKIAQVLRQTLGSLVIQAEEMTGGTIKRPAPTIIPSYINRNISLPKGLTHIQLEQALNRTMAILDQIGLDPESGDIQGNIYSGAVSNIITKSIAEVSAFVRNVDTRHPDLYNPTLARDDQDWGLEMKASKRPNKGGESHNPGRGWFMIVIYKVIERQTHIIQVEVAQLTESDWIVHDRNEGSSRTRTAITLDHATRRLRQNSVYLHPEYVREVGKNSRKV